MCVFAATCVRVCCNLSLGAGGEWKGRACTLILMPACCAALFCCCCCCRQELLAAGKGPGMSWRGTESGQLLLDLVRHGDVAEWALWINSFGDSVYRGLWGDKDTYALAFGVAGKAQEFNQVQVGGCVLAHGVSHGGRQQACVYVCMC